MAVANPIFDALGMGRISYFISGITIGDIAVNYLINKYPS